MFQRLKLQNARFRGILMILVTEYSYCFMEVLQKINSIISAGFFRWRNFVVCAGVFFFLFSAAGIKSLCAVSRQAVPQTFEKNTILPEHGYCSAAALRGSSTLQLVQTVLRSGRTSQQYSPVWRLRAILQTSIAAVSELLHQQLFFQQKTEISFSFQRYLRTSLPVRAGPFCG